MESDKLLHFLNSRHHSGYSLLHNESLTGLLSLLKHAMESVAKLIPKILAARDSDGYHCIHIIAMMKHKNVRKLMNIILSLGADINAQEMEYGFTPLHFGVKRQNYDLVKWMCKVPGIDLEIQDWKKKTAYRIAHENGDRKMMKILKMAGAKRTL